MKRVAVVQAVVLLLLALVAVAAAFAAWLGLTPSGARALLSFVSRTTPLAIEARTVEGKLLGDLRLGEVRARLPHRTIRIRRLHVSWFPHGLLGGRLLVRELVAEGMRMQDDSPPGPKAPGFAWPRVSGAAARFDARVETLRLNDVVYRRRDEKPQVLSHLAASVRWTDGILALDGLAVTIPAARASGTVVAGFRRPSLATDLHIVLTAPAADLDRVSIRTRLLPGKGAEIIQGAVAVTGFAGAATRASAAGEAGFMKDAVRLHRVRLSQAGRKGSVVVSGMIRMTEELPRFDLQADLERVDLHKEAGTPTVISGRLAVAGDRTRYRGTLSLRNDVDGWRSGAIAAAFSGTGTDITFTGIRGSILDGTVAGEASIGWEKGITVRAQLAGRGIDPSRVDRRWQGTINADIGADVTPAPGGIRGTVRGTIADSTFQGYPFSGTVAARVEGKAVEVERLALQGKGFAVTAFGNLAERLTFATNVTDLASLVPGTTGAVTARGWVHWTGGMPDGEVIASGAGVAAGGVALRDGSVRAKVGTGDDPPLSLAASLNCVVRGDVRADSVVFSLEGSAQRHTSTATITLPRGRVAFALDGGYRDREWQGVLSRVEGEDPSGPWHLLAPAPLRVSQRRVVVTGVELAGSSPVETVALSADITMRPLRGSVRGEWSSVLLRRGNPFLAGIALDGVTSGAVDFRLLADDRFTARGRIEARGGVTARGERVQVDRGALDVDWRQAGLKGTLHVSLPDGSSVAGTFESPAPPRFALPAAGEADLRWSGVNLALLRPWMPKGITVDGTAAGRVTARLLPDKRFDMLGKASLGGGKVRMENPDGSLATAVRSMELSWAWRDEGLRGGLSLELAQWGHSRGEFAVPLPARLPVALVRTAPIQAYLTGEVQELGVISALFPGVAQESHGVLSYDLRAEGTADAPTIAGKVSLSQAGAFIPSAGIRVSHVQLQARLADDRIIVDTFRADSGPGHLEGNAEIELRNGKPVSYRGSIGGNRFEAIRLPELRVQIDPRLTFTGTTDRVAVSGDIRIPELRVTGETPEASVEPSRDVVITDAPPAEPPGRFTVALAIGVELGDHVTVKAKGIDARLGGRLTLTGDNLERLTSKGEIKVVQGRYKAYGLDLTIVRGRVFYAGGPVAAPTLDILALRTVGEVKAGVTVGGTVQAPTVKLYSEPPMPDVDVVAYMVLGHPLGQSGEQASLVSSAAGALLSAGQSVALQDQLKSRLGLSTLELGGAEQEEGHMGYRPVTVAPGTGVAPRQAPSGVSQTMLTVGTYLTPKLYVSYGRSLFTGSNLFRLRYDITKHWQVETQAGGGQSGADLYYTIEFN